MQDSTRVCTKATFLAALAMVLFRLADLPFPAAIAKLTASTTFVALAWSAGASRWPYGRLILVGLVLSWWGDAFLIGSSQTLFLAGLVSFLLAHVAYSGAFLRWGIRWTWSLAAVLPVAAISVTANLWLAPHVPDDMALPVRVYTLIISLMLVLAFGARGAGASFLVPLGATLFYFSDLSVAMERFVRPDFPTYVWGLPFYFGGQVLLALSTRTPRDSASPAE